MNGEPAQVKGLIFNGAKRWMLDRFGEEGFHRFVSRLPEDERRAWDARMFRVIDWYPAAMFVHMYQAVMKLWGGGDPGIFQEGAGHVAKEDLSTVMKVLMKIGTPAFVSSRFPTVYAQYFNVGELAIVDYGAEMLEAELTGAQGYGEGCCEGILGWTRQALVIAGAEAVEARHVDCLLHGGLRCRFSYRWR